MTITVPQLKSYIEANLNVIITGEAGTGKTEMLKAACREAGLQMKYYSASTMDVFSELVGLPVPDKETKTMEYYRPAEVDQAEVMFFDELNRADGPTLNKVFEIIQFRSVNGIRLPKLRCVVAAINPVSDDYDTDEIDRALLDRFDLYLEAQVEANRAYFRRKYGDDYARVGIGLFDEYQKDFKNSLRSKDNKMGYFSPRRLDKLMEIYQKFPRDETIRNVLPSDVVLSPRVVAGQFNAALAASTASSPKSSSKKPSQPVAGGDLSILAQEQVKKKPADLRKKANASKFIAAYQWARENNPSLAERLRKNASEALAYNIGPTTFDSVWKSVARDFTQQEESSMMSSWDSFKIQHYRSRKRNW